MVAQITEGTAFDKHGRPFRRRNPRPAIVVLVFLVVAVGVVWTIALTRPTKVREAQVCNPPEQQAGSAPTQLGEQVSRTAMTDVTPAKLSDTKVRVLNASGRGGQAADVAGAMKDLGGTAGQAAAAAVWLVAPCTELFNDNRADDSVDLAVGTEFTALAHNDDIDAVLASLRPGSTGPSDPILVTKIHASSC